MVKIVKEIDAIQWKGEETDLPEGMHLCRPEVHWSADRKLVYFTYADLRCHNWIGVEETPIAAGEEPPENGGFEGGVRVKRDDDSEYVRRVLPFTFWSVKSEAQITRDHRAVYLDKSDESLVRVFVDYCYVEKWSNPLPPRAEFRVVDGGYGRGFRPYYLSPGNWLLSDTGENGKQYRVVTDEAFKALRAA